MTCELDNLWIICIFPMTAGIHSFPHKIYGDWRSYNNILRSVMPVMIVCSPEIYSLPHRVSQRGHNTCNYWTTNIFSLCDRYTDNFFYLYGKMECTETNNCKYSYRNGFHAPKLVRNDISQLIVGLLVNNLSCSKNRLQPSSIFTVFGWTRHASFKI